jgi:hypothetical protein
MLAMALIAVAPAKSEQATAGLQPGARVFVVTTLADAGPGSLRAAIAEAGPRLVVFAVGGSVVLQSNLSIDTGDITIAGETAPSPGVILRNGTLGIRSSNVAISHLSIFPGSTRDPSVGESRDALTVYGSPSRRNVVSDVALRHMSLGWGVDENLGLQGLVDGLRIEYALIAQPLRFGGHPKGAHSMNVLLGNRVGRVTILGSLLAGADQRSPRLTNGNRVSFVNNVVLGHGRHATHIDLSREIFARGGIDVIGNVYVGNANSQCKDPLIRIDANFFAAQPPTAVHVADNVALGERTRCRLLANGIESQLAPRPTQTLDRWPLLPSSRVMASVLERAGSHPAFRSALDRRVMQGVRDATLPIIADESAFSTEADWPERRHDLSLPVAGRLATSGDVERMATFLCKRRASIGDAARCPG